MLELEDELKVYSIVGTQNACLEDHITEMHEFN